MNANILIPFKVNVPQSKSTGDHTKHRSTDVSPDSQSGIEESNLKTSTSDIDSVDRQNSPKTADSFNETLQKKIESATSEKKSGKKGKSENSQSADKDKKNTAPDNIIAHIGIVVAQNESTKTTKTAPSISGNKQTVDKTGDASSKTQTEPTEQQLGLEKKHKLVPNSDAVNNKTSTSNEGTPSVLKQKVSQDTTANDAKQFDDHSQSEGDSVDKTQEGPINSKVFTNKDTSAVSESVSPQTANNGSTSKTAPELPNLNQTQSVPGKNNSAAPKAALSETIDKESTSKTASELPEAELAASLDNTLSENPVSQSAVNKMNIQANQVNKIQTAESLGAGTGENGQLQTGLEMTSSSENGLTSSITEVTDTQTESSVIEVKGNPGTGLGRQVEESISSVYRPDTKQMIVRLDPPELGRLTIKFVENREGDITAVLQADKSQTRDQIQQALPAIVQNLQNSGVQIKKFDVQLNYEQSNTSGQNPNGHNNPSEHSTPEAASSSDKRTYDPLSESQETSTNIPDTGAQSTSDSINILI